MNRPLLSLDRVSKSYWRGRHETLVLDEVSFELDAGEFAAIFGQRASGKTTLLRIAAGIEPCDSGSVTFDGEDLVSRARRRGASLHPRIGWMRREGPFLPSMEMLDYVALPLLRPLRHEEAHRLATRALRRIGADHLARARWRELSNAERTLVMIAQAIVREPALLIADDPTMGLSTTEREDVLSHLRDIAEDTGMAVLMAVPDVPDMLRSHTVMSLSDGELIRPTRRSARADVIEFPRGRGESA
ncbi:MAG: ATP-binding cassette domain-containing protein [Actinobacteria bacterium]|nr:ATP-binding cassette domain-containing protein [Actinomycetota bacterium]